MFLITALFYHLEHEFIFQVCFICEYPQCIKLLLQLDWSELLGVKKHWPVLIPSDFKRVLLKLLKKVPFFSLEFKYIPDTLSN